MKVAITGGPFFTSKKPAGSPDEYIKAVNDIYDANLA